MSSLCVWLFLLFSIIGLFLYASYKVINNRQLWEKVCRKKDNLKDRYEDEKVYIGKLKDKIDDLKATKAPNEKTSSSDDTEDLKKENEILKQIKSYEERK